MAFTHTLTRNYRDSSGTQLGGTDPVTADSEFNFDGAIPHGSPTNYQVHWAMTVANMKSIIIICDQAVTLKTNSSGSPQETIDLAANQVLMWSLDNDGAGKIPFAGDITSIYVTIVTPGSSDANLKIRSLALQA